MRLLIDRIRAVWGGHDDFETGGFEYVAFIIQQDLRDMADAGYEREASLRELADIVVNAVRAIDELGRYDDPAAVLNVIHARLNVRMDGQTDDIIEEYQSRYERAKVGSEFAEHLAINVAEEWAEGTDEERIASWLREAADYVDEHGAEAAANNKFGVSPSPSDNG